MIQVVYFVTILSKKEEIHCEQQVVLSSAACSVFFSRNFQLFIHYLPIRITNTHLFERAYLVACFLIK